MSFFVGSRTIPEVEYHRPKELAAALVLLRELKGGYKLIAGGTDLIPAIRRGALSPDFSHWVDLRSIKELGYIRQEDSLICIGAVTRLADIEASPIIRKDVPHLAEAVGQIGSLQIRSQGTIGGNLSNASPAADTAPPLLTLEAKILLKSIDRQRVVLLDQFFLGPGKTVLSVGEILAEIQIPIPRAEERYCFLKLGRRNAFTLAIVSVATRLKIQNGVFQGVRIALGAVAPVPIRVPKAEGFLTGQRVSEPTITNGARIASDEVQPISDVRASAAYRKDMSYVLTRRAILSCMTPKPAQP